MIKLKNFYIFFFILFLSIKPSNAKIILQSELINELVNEASIILSSSDPVELFKNNKIK